MILRRLFLVAVLVGSVWYYTTEHQSGMGGVGSVTLAPTGANGPLTLTEAHAAPEYDAEELNNISVYKRVSPSVVNITSTTVTMSLFYGLVPQQGQGSGFILDKQ